MNLYTLYEPGIRSSITEHATKTRVSREREREWEQTQCIRAIETRGSSSGRLHSHQPAMRQSGGMQQHCLRHSWNRALFVCGLMSPLRLIDVLLKAWMSHVFSRPGGHVTQLGAAVRRVVWCIGSAGVLKGLVSSHSWKSFVEFYIFTHLPPTYTGILVLVAAVSTPHLRHVCYG